MILCTFSNSIIRSQSEPSNFKPSDYALRNITSFLDVFVVAVVISAILFLLFTRIEYIPEVLYYMSEVNEPIGL